VTQPISPLSDVGLTGVVSSGAQPIVGAHVYLLAAGTTGYGGNGITAGNVSVSVVSAAETGTSDSVGAYVVTDANGKFSLTGDYACSSGQQLYLYALGGNAGSGVNSAIGLMAVVGSCPNSSGPAVFATVNEVSTIAAAYAFAGFATDATHVSSSGTALAQVGVANAFANAGNLATLATGVALATTPAGNGTVPQAEINTLANVLASCVNAASGCSTLLSTATADGTSAGTKPTDTATAAINIAHSPVANVAALFALSISTPPFAPALGAQPNDFTVSVNFTGGGLNGSVGVAVDSSGDLWAVNYAGNSVTELASSGSPLSGSSGYTGGSLSSPAAVAIDGSGNAWIANYGGLNIVKMSSSGAVLSGLNGFGGGAIGAGAEGPWAIAVDGLGNAWTINDNGGNVTELSGSGSPLQNANGSTTQINVGGLYALAIDGSRNVWLVNHLPAGNDVTKLSNGGTQLIGYTGGGLNTPHAIAIDGGGNAWVANFTPNFSGGSVSKFSNLGSPLSASGFAGGGLSSPQWIAVDGASNVWVANNGNGNVVELSSSGAFLSGTSGFATNGGHLNSLAPDGSGNVWVATFTGVAEFIGAGAPVVTPICAGLPATPTADGSSKLGTRP
jgi:hypothetical protein